MKAIVILFSGEFKGKTHKKDAISTIASIISETTGCTDINIHEFDDLSVSKVLVSKSTEEEDNVATLINSFACDVINEVGNPMTFVNANQFKKEFLKRFLNDTEMRKNNTEAIKYLINTGKLKPTYSKILSDNNIPFITDYLKEINQIINLF